MVNDADLQEHSSRHCRDYASWRDKWPFSTGLDVVVVVSLVGVFLWDAIRGLAPKGWVGDDAWVVAATAHADSVTELIDLGFTHPGFNLILRALSRNATDQIAFQIVPMIAAVAALIVMYNVAKHATGNTLISWLTLLPFATSFLLFRYALAVKPYTIEILAFALALYALQRATTITNKHLIIWAIAIVPIATLSFRISYISAVAAFGLYWAHKIRLRQLIALATAHALTLGPLLAYILSTFSNERLTRWWENRPGVFNEEGTSTITTTWQQLSRATRVIADGPTALAWILVTLILIGAINAIIYRKAPETAATAALTLAITLSITGRSPFGPENLPLQRIDLWLAPALLLLTINGAKHLTTTLTPKLPKPPPLPTLKPALTTTLILIATITIATTTPNHHYPDNNIEQNLAFALTQLNNHPTAIMVGTHETGIRAQFASHYPDTIQDVAADPSHMRGWAIALDPELIRINRFLNDDELTADRVIGVRLQREDKAAFRARLTQEGFAQTQYPQFPHIDIWDRTQ